MTRRIFSEVVNYCAPLAFALFLAGLMSLLPRKQNDAHDGYAVNEGVEARAWQPLDRVPETAARNGVGSSRSAGAAISR